MPWFNGDYPPSYKNQPPKLRAKAVEIANALLAEGVSEGIAIATGLKQARKVFTPSKRYSHPPKRKNRIGCISFHPLQPIK
jgi:uncharacterized protein YdaT